MREAEVDEVDVGREEKRDGLADLVGGRADRRAGGWAAAVEHEDVEAPERVDCARHERVALGRHREVGGEPVPPIRAASRSSTSARRAARQTCAPSSARASAIARPMPCEAPRTSAPHPVSPRSIRSAY